MLRRGKKRKKKRKLHRKKEEEKRIVMYPSSPSLNSPTPKSDFIHAASPAMSQYQKVKLCMRLSTSTQIARYKGLIRYGRKGIIRRANLISRSDKSRGLELKGKCQIDWKSGD